MCEWSVPDWGGATAPSPPPDHLYSPPNSLVRCELPSDPLWAKMSSTGASSKKRKKPDTKPQSQLAKSLNEKRRRELENVFIEELAELISASSADMSSLSVKPDKCAILQETVNQIRRQLKEQESAATIDVVQQGEVSSSKPAILTSEVFGPLLLEALEGFLFVVNHDGKIEYVTDNISSFIKFSKDEVLGQPVYNILHHGDHGRFTSTLLPTVWSTLEGSSSSMVASGGGAASNSNNPPRNRTFNCRFLIKPPDDSNQTVEEKQQRVSKYENMQVVQINSSQIAQLTSGADKDDEGNAVGPCLMCVARRIMPNEKHSGTSMEQFSMKMDPLGKIIGVDTTGLSPGFAQYISKDDLKGRNLDDIVHAGDYSKVTNHLKEAQSQTQATSSIYRIRVTAPNSIDKYIHVQTKSKLFKSMSSEPNFIMSTHSIVAAGGEEQFIMGEANSPASISGQSTSSSMGNQIMLSGSVNGGAPSRGEATASNVSSSDLANTINSLSNSSTFQNALNQGLGSNDLNYDINSFTEMFPSSTWGELSERNWERSESRTSLTPAPSPLAPAPATPSFTSSNFPFSPPLDDKESNDASGSNNPCRLRHLLTEGVGGIKRESTDSESGAVSGGGGSSEHGGEKNKYSLLTQILNEKDGDQSSHHPDQSPHNKSKNNMLLQLLNKNDDDDMDQKSGASDDLLLNNLGLGSLTTSQAEKIRRGTKRPSSEENQGMNSGGNTPQSGDDGPNSAKRPSQQQASNLLENVPPSGSVSSSSFNTNLREKNRMLAALLANPPSTPTSIPPLPASVISATPHDKLPRVIKNNPSSGWSGCNVQQGSGIPQSPGSQGAGGGPVRQGGSNMQQPVASPNYPWGGDESSDPYLSHILDQVIEIAPEDSPALANIISSIENNTAGSLSGQFQQDFLNEKINERMAINAIQKSLMQCETLQQSMVQKTPVYTMSQVQGQQQFNPPPVYQQARQRLPMPTLSRGQYIGSQQQQQLLLQQQQRNKLLQQQTKARLLQLQQQQQLLIPSNAAASSGDPSGIHNMDSLMNSTVAPNVSLQRSGSLPDSQLSPVGSYSGSGASTPNLIGSGGSQISPGLRQPFSPQPFSPVNGGINSFQGSGGGGGSTASNQSGQGPTSQGGQQARMSPSSLQNFQQAQLSPRLSQGQSAGYVQTQSTSWSQQQANRISIQQQQNPMLNAQLTGGNYNSSGARNFNPGTPPGAGGGTPPTSAVGNGGRVGLPPVRSLPSPGSRQSPYPPELSPTPAGSGTNYQFRTQRSLSGGPPHQSVVPQATTHLPGGPIGGSGGGRMYKEQVPYHHHYHPPHVTHQHPQHPLLYQPHPTDQGYPGQGYPDGYRQHPPGGNNGMTEYVKHEIRAMVGARTGSGGAGLRNAGGGGQQNQQVGLSPQQLETLGFAIELQPHGVGDSQKMWSNMSDMGAGSPQSASLQSRSLEDVNRSNDQKSSLLQKLLSE